MKKLISLIMVFVLMLCPISVSADEYQEGYVTVTYEMEGTYMLVIPSSVSSDEDFTISISDVNLARDEYVKLNLGAMWNDGCIHLFNDEDVANGLSESECSYVQVALYANDAMINDYSTFGYLYNSGDYINMRTEYYGSSDGRAGTYTGTITFCASIGSM